MNLKDVFKIQEVLKKAGYYDISRISNEVYTYSTQNNISLESILQRISNYEPWEYIQGFTEFRGSKFFVTRDTLIPRIETEQLVDIALNLIQKRKIEKVIDVGSGSGCIIISIAEECRDKNVRFVGIDISKEALSIATKNDWNKKVEFIHQDLIKKSDLEENTLVVANLPYIPTKMYEDLDRSVKDFEPKEALDGGIDGLRYYEKLIDIIQKSKRDIWLLIEIEPSTLKNLTRYTKDIPLKIIEDYREKKRFALFHFS